MGPIRRELVRVTGSPRPLLAAIPWLLALGIGCDPVTESRELGHPRGTPLVQRVVSLAPLATRFVVAIGARDRLIAVDAESAKLPGISDLPTAELDTAARFGADLVLVAALPDPQTTAALERSGARITEFAPHDFEDVIPLVRELGAALVGAEAATEFESAFSNPLAAIGGASGGQPRPRVVAVVGFDPLEIAGGHSFETDLIEIAGGHSVTHPGEEVRLAIAADRWSALAPDLVLVIGAPPASRHDEQAVRNALPPGAAVAFFPFDREFWIDASDEPARRLRALIEPIAARQAAGDRVRADAAAGN
jgi:ABC-type Fe3+-hydroxamate transport system substrate-binding protein